MVDIDFLACEYDNGRPVAIVEYKREDSPPQTFNHPSIRVLRGLATAANLPFFVVRYAADLSWWKVVPLNVMARRWLSKQVEMVEVEYVSFLYQLRGREVPTEVRGRIEGVISG